MRVAALLHTVCSRLTPPLVLALLGGCGDSGGGTQIQHDDAEHNTGHGSRDGGVDRVASESSDASDTGGAMDARDGGAEDGDEPRSDADLDAGGDERHRVDAGEEVGGPDAGGTEPDANTSAPARIKWTGGHGDLTLSLSPSDEGATLQAFFQLEGATLDGVARSDGEFAADELEVTSQAIFARPDPDNGFFAPLCVEPGQTTHWLPQRNNAASAMGAPFVGLRVDVERGVFVDDELKLELIDVRSPSNAGHYSMWRDGFPPAFPFASCDGINSTDSVVLPIGHDHFNMAFTEPGRWEVDYRVRGVLIDEASALSADVTVHYLLE